MLIDEDNNNHVDDTLNDNNDADSSSSSSNIRETAIGKKYIALSKFSLLCLRQLFLSQFADCN